MLIDREGEILLLSVLANGLQRGVSRIKAQQEWIPQNFIAARWPYPSSLRSLKHQFEHRTRYYLHEDEMAKAFRANGIKVIGENVYAKRLA
jgi:hypothetical protein